MPKIPHLIPTRPAGTSGSGGGGLPSANPFSLYDVALNGTGFMYASSTDNPSVRETAQYEKPRVDQESTPGEQTLTNWWLKSQESFHGGAGQLNLEPPVDSPVVHVRYDLSRNVDVSVPGLVTRLPDTRLVSSLVPVGLIGMQVSGADVLVVADTTGAVSVITNLDAGTPTVTPFAGAAGVKALATDGGHVYAATTTQILSLDPAAPAAAAVVVANYPGLATSGPTVGWVKSRLFLGVNGAVYEVDVSQVGVALGASQLLYQHPSPGWVWRAFSDSPSAALAAGDAGVFSEVVQFTINSVAGAPVLQVGSTIWKTPAGERILSLDNSSGSFEIIGTTRGIRVGMFESLYGRLQVGPLTLQATDPTIAANAVVTRDRFAYAVGLAYDEAGLIAVDLGVQTDQAGRFAWHPHLIAPAIVAGTVATTGTVLPVSSRIAFGVPGAGVYLEGVGAGSGREAWLRTSRIRYGTAEPKLFKLGSVRADLTSATVNVTGTTETAVAPLVKLGFTTKPPPEFALPSGLAEWLQLEFDVSGNVKLRSYQVKALPGTKRQVRIKLVLAVYDNESSRSGQNIRDHLAARDRRNILEQLAGGGDEVLLQEFTPSGVQSTLVVVESVAFNQIGRPSKTSDVGGTADVILRTLTS